MITTRAPDGANKRQNEKPNYWQQAKNDVEIALVTKPKSKLLPNIVTSQAVQKKTKTNKQWNVY